MKQTDRMIHDIPLDPHHFAYGDLYHRIRRERALMSWIECSGPMSAFLRGLALASIVAACVAVCSLV